MIEMRRKVCLVGDENVGKTCIVRRFVYNMFDEAYLRTVGTMISKREVEMPELELRMNLVIWDIMGRREFMELFKEAYFRHVGGIVAVFDLTRPRTFHSLDHWIGGLRSCVGKVPTIIVGNKMDLEQAEGLREDDIHAYCETHGFKCFRTSAKTGENVDEAIGHLAKEMAHESQPDYLVPRLETRGTGILLGRPKADILIAGSAPSNERNRDPIRSTRGRKSQSRDKLHRNI